MIYERYFPKKKALLNVYKQWSEAFYATTKEEAEKNCEKQGLEYDWTSTDCLITRNRLPSVVTHAQTNKKCLSFTLFNEFAACIDINKNKENKGQARIKITQPKKPMKAGQHRSCQHGQGN